ncbi:MAG TPA: hypothetical protein VHC69_01795 [Polyangiaceae bacterium]|nr:hypothetical protein [Polyangiaceae bacterium]
MRALPYGFAGASSALRGYFVVPASLAIDVSPPFTAPPSFEAPPLDTAP